jgi:hypothetical protein
VRTLLAEGVKDAAKWLKPWAAGPAEPGRISTLYEVEGTWRCANQIFAGEPLNLE